MSMSNRDVDAERTRRQWQVPTVKRVGTVADVLRGGGGKLSPTAADPGDVRVQKPAG